jgi:catechol 2,3-dioxygenase-like lactoylglutathione lyase family enzyme
MFTRVDHLVIAVPTIERARERYQQLGFHVFDAGTNEGEGTRSAVVFYDDQYLELLAIEDDAAHAAAASRDAAIDPGLGAYVAAGGGIRFIALATDDLATEVATMRSRGVEVSEPARHARTTPDGRRVEWLAAVPLGAFALPLLFVQHLSDLEARRAQAPQRAPHPNGLRDIERIYVAGTDIAQMVDAYSTVLGGPPPTPQDGIIIKANMARYAFADSDVVAAEAYGPGPTQDAMDARGPGPFQAIHRSDDITASACYLEDHGVAIAATGRRANQELVLLVGPGDAFGYNLGFVGRD